MIINAEKQAVITLSNVEKDYITKSQSFRALTGIDLQIHKGEFVFIVGRSGSGKSTLLNMISGIDIPTDGDIEILSTPINVLNENKRAGFRGKHIGIVFQFFQLMPTISVIDNVMLPMYFCNYLTPKKRKERAVKLLERVGISDQAKKLPAELSGGQQQRVAIARALANNPEVLIADEPTGNLDSESADIVFKLLKELTDEGITVVMVTHEKWEHDDIDREITIHDGCIVADRVVAKEVQYV